jgi:deferrochelatase/peroxidase EfeB
MADLQEGIYHAKKTRPGAFFAIIFLQAAQESGAEKVGAVLADLWQMFQGLKEGRVQDLDPVVVPHDSDDLQTLMGFGPNAFGLPGISGPPPRGFKGSLFRSPQGRGGPLLPGSGLKYASDLDANPATEHICVQVTAQTKLAVDRAIVETWKTLLDAVDSSTGIADLAVTAFYLGFQRSDRRSWIDFHDGLSNLEANQRERVIVTKRGQDEDWCVGGTYLAFLRIAVDLPAWRKLDRREQELLVGRDKLTGCPLIDIEPDGTLHTDPGCPVAGTQIWESPNDPRFAEPPPAVGADEIRASHVHRASHHSDLVDEPRSRRIFRQGYEFLEWQQGSPGFRLGLNFVSFQDTPARVVEILRMDGWLGQVNFGGDPEAQPAGMESLLSVYAAGIYFVPPVVPGEPFPGAGAFGVS